MLTADPDNAATIDVADLHVTVRRTGDRVRGVARFPASPDGRCECVIDYRSRQLVAGQTEFHAPTDRRARLRLYLVERWRKLCADQPSISATSHAAAIVQEAHAEGLRCSASSLRVWANRLDVEGKGALCDRYTPAPRKLPAFDPRHAKGALLVCAWWAYRIGNCQAIETKMMIQAVGLIAAGYKPADLIATIDAYYGWNCDRGKYPFKPFSRWARHDLHKWIQRAAGDADYKRAMASARQRKRSANCHHTHRAIKELTNPEQCPTGDPPSTVAAARWVNRLGYNHAAHQLAAQPLPTQQLAAATDRPPPHPAPSDTPLSSLVADREPQTVAQALATLDDAYRVMLIEAAQADRVAIGQAVTTMALWWDRMPQGIRNNIAFKVDVWRREHPHVTDHQAATRRLQMLLPCIRDHRCGAQCLAVAARLPA